MIHFTEYERYLAETPFEEIGMIAYLAELHDQIHQVLHLSLCFHCLEEVLHGYFSFNTIIEHFLPMSHFARYCLFDFWSDFLLYIFFQTTKHKWLQD